MANLGQAREPRRSSFQGFPWRFPRFSLPERDSRGKVGSDDSPESVGGLNHERTETTQAAPRSRLGSAPQTHHGLERRYPGYAHPGHVACRRTTANSPAGGALAAIVLALILIGIEELVLRLIRRRK